MVTRAASRGSCSLRSGFPPHGVSTGQGDLDQVGLAVAERHQPHQIADGNGLFDQRGQHPRGGHRDVDAPRLVEEPLVAGIVGPGHHPRHRELRLGEQADHHVDLVVARRGDHDVELLQMDRLEQGQLTRVAEAPVRGGDGVDVDVVGIAFEQRDVVPVLDELPGDGAADGTRTGDRDLHYAPSLSSLGGSAAMASASAMWPAIAATYT